MKTGEPVDLYLDPVTGDLPDLAVDGLLFSTNSASIAQGVYTRLSLVKGEWFADLSAGFPHYEILGRKDIVAKARAAYRSTILGSPGIVSLDSLILDMNKTTRILTVTWSARGKLDDTPIAGTLPVSF